MEEATYYIVRKVQTPADMKEAHRIRFEVFVDEQHVDANNELDDLEDISTHFLAFATHSPTSAVGTCRMYSPTPTKAVIGRLAVVKSMRGKGVGAALMRGAEDEAREKGLKSVELHAQCYASGFYERVGYVKESEETFMEEGIEHCSMVKML
ncbi:hypothetical protein HK104_005873 [Borealophlyctis nickersoniae]|nr:hypothetical protein HK104_005873 [Borealophlyctis nickersoniae]